MSDPRQKDFDERHTRLPTVTALTKREYFAAIAMQGIISACIVEGVGPQYEEETVAQNAIKIADELLKQLES
jgi:hypothetical protein